MLFPSCKKYLDIDPPRNQLINESVFRTDNSAIAALIGIYTQLVDNLYDFSYSAATQKGGLLADELDYFFQNAVNDEFELNELLPTNSSIGSLFWKPCYKHIYQATAVIEGVTASTTVSGAVKNQVTGEAKFLRAFCYFYLVNFFGDVPLVTSTNFAANAVLPRSPQQDIYNQIITDLKDAQVLLDNNYVTGEKVRVNRMAATALLARTYLYLKDWENAQTEATAILSSGLFTPLPSLESVFLKNSQEAIFQLMATRTGTNTQEGYDFIPAPATSPLYVFRSEIQDAFETGDKRWDVWVKQHEYLGETYYHPYKYKVRVSVNNQLDEHYMLLRAAEQYLIRAEARAQLDDLQGAEDDINIIRTRAGLDDLVFSDKPMALMAIEQERRIELMAEWGHRWFDLKRMPSLSTPGSTRADDVLAPIKPGWQSSDIYFPIPQTEMNTNPFLEQNDGYN